MINNRKIIGSLFLLSIFILLMGTAFATEDIAKFANSSDETILAVEYGFSDNLNEYKSDIVEVDSNSGFKSDDNIFINPDFEEGDCVDDEFSDYEEKTGNVYGWNVTKTPGGHWDGHTYTPCGFIAPSDPDGYCDINSRVLMVMKEDDGKYYVSQYVDFTSVKSINFTYWRDSANTQFNVYVGDDLVKEVVASNRINKGTVCTIDLTDKNYEGVKLFKIEITKIGNYYFFDNFIVNKEYKLISDFTFEPTVNRNNISVQFNNKAKGNLANVIWDFGDGTNSSDMNPIHTFTSGNYIVTLTVSDEYNTTNCTYNLNLIYPTINGQMYNSVQDAIEDAEEGAVIDIPNDLSENLNINKTVTLNFNGNKLTGSINVNDGAIVTVNNISDVSSVSTDDSSKLTIADSNINSNLELKSGNIDLNSVNFNNSILTITSANTTLVNVNVANGGIVINGGKSKITKSNFTDSTNVITQNDGELELTNNIIKNNNNAINITGGSATISYNAIYNNTGDLTLTGATVTNNWFGTNQVTGYESYLRLVLTSTDSEMYPDSEYTIKVEFVPNTGSMDGALNDLTLDITSTNGEITSPIIITDNQGELKFTAGTISDEVKFTLLGEEYTLVNDDNPVSIVAKPLDTNLVINSSAKGVVVIKLTTAEGNVVGAIVSYSINGAEKINATTDDNGEIIIKDLTGKVEINATYAGNKTLNPITGNGAFDFTETTDNKTNTSSDSKPTTTTHTQTATAKTVKVASKIVAKKKTFKVKTKTKKYKITLKTKSGKAIKKVKVTLKVKGKTYKAKTNAKGVATFKITKLNKKGKYTAKIKFAGNKSYKATSKKIKLTVKK